MRDSKDTLDSIRNKFNNGGDIISEDTIRNLIREELMTQTNQNKQDDVQQQGVKQQYEKKWMNEQKNIKFNQNSIQEINQGMIRKDQNNYEKKFLGFQIIYFQQFDYLTLLYFINYYNLQDLIQDDLRNTVLFEDIANQKQITRQVNNGLWDEILLFYNKYDYNSCYQIVLDAEDDIYLIKLMMLTGPCLKELEIETSKRLMSRLCMILDSKFLDKMYLSVFDHSLNENILSNLTSLEQKKITNEVYKLTSSSNPDVGEKSAELYIKLAQKFSTQF